MDKKYGLQLRVKPQQQKKPVARPPLPKPALGFGGDDDEDDVEREISRQAYKNKSLKDVEEQQRKALEEDPSAFDYDGVYDEMKQKGARPIMKDRQERKPKYIQALIEKAKQREREHEVIYERKLVKERSKDDHIYADKDKFVTSAYKKKLAEQAKWMEEERLRELREEKDDVTKKTDITDFYFNLGKNVAFGGREAELRKAEEPCEEPGVRREKPVTKSPEKMPSSSSAVSESSKVTKRQESEASLSPRERSEESGPKPVSDPSAQDKTANETPASEQPKSDHHKRTQDALAAAKERFLARKKVKEQ